MNEEQILKARLKDLAFKSYKQNIYTYTSFLSPADMTVFDTLRDELSYVDYETNGGLDICERRMIGFGSREQLGYDGVWPIKLSGCASCTAYPPLTSQSQKKGRKCNEPERRTRHAAGANNSPPPGGSENETPAGSGQTGRQP